MKSPFQRQQAGLTLIIPLHAARPWVENVSEIIKNSPASARIIVSDQSFVDDALEILKEKHRYDARLHFSAVAAEVGWREHVNWLLPRVETEMFSIMPQDDSFSPGYYEQLIAALQSDPDAGIAFGRMDAFGLNGMDTPVRFESMPDVGGGEHWEAAIKLVEQWNLGIAYRGVIRTRLRRPVLPTPGDRFADLVWMYGLALSTKLVEVQGAIYRKRYFKKSTHAQWEPLTETERYQLFLREMRRTFTFRVSTYRRVVSACRAQGWQI